MRPLIALVLCLVTGTAIGHAEHGSEAAAAAGHDCEHPPANAARALPEAIAGFSALACHPHGGQYLGAGAGWHWRFPGSYFVVPTVPAFSPSAKLGHAGARFFTDMHVRRLTGEAARQRHETIAKSVPTYLPAKPPESILQLTAINDLGHAFDVFFPLESDRRGWAVICTPECAPEYVFIIDRFATVGGE